MLEQSIIDLSDLKCDNKILCQWMADYFKDEIDILKGIYGETAVKVKIGLVFLES